MTNTRIYPPWSNTGRDHPLDLLLNRRDAKALIPFLDPNQGDLIHELGLYTQARRRNNERRFLVNLYERGRPSECAWSTHGNWCEAKPYREALLRAIKAVPSKQAGGFRAQLNRIDKWLDLSVVEKIGRLA